MNANPVLHHRPTARPRVAVRRAASLLMAATAWLACAPRASAQANLVAPRLQNDGEIRQAAGAVVLPDSAREGEAHLRFRVLADGTLDTATVAVEHATHPAFAAAAVDLTRNMRFAPARKGETPVAVWYRHPVFFRGDAGRFDLSSGEGTYDISAIEVAPRLLNPRWVGREIEARYPPEHVKTGTPGDVLVRMKVLATGAVDSASVVAEASTDTAFETPAVTVTRQMRFSPALVAGRSVATWITIPIRFEVVAPAADSAATNRQPSAAPPAAAGQPPGPISGRAGSVPFASRARRQTGDGHARRTEARA